MKFYLIVRKDDPTILHYNARGIAIYTDKRRAEKHAREDANIRWNHKQREYESVDLYHVKEFDTEEGIVIE